MLKGSTMAVRYSRGCAFAFGPVAASQTWQERVAAFCDRPALRGHDYCARHLAEERDMTTARLVEDSGPYTLGCDTLGCDFTGSATTLAIADERYAAHMAAHPGHDAWITNDAADAWEGSHGC